MMEIFRQIKNKNLMWNIYMHLRLLSITKYPAVMVHARETIFYSCTYMRWIIRERAAQKRQIIHKACL